MPLKLFYITNRPEIAAIAENAGVDRIFVDMEYIGKAKRQGGMDTVQSHHTIQDVENIRQCLTKAELLVRCNPIHDAGADCASTEDEIDGIVAAGADVIMLPFFKTADEVRRFLEAVGGRCRTILLLETPEAAVRIDDILSVQGADEVFIGLNDLCLGYGQRFMFQLLADGTVERLALKIRQKGIPFGFGGIAAIGTGTLPAEAILKEHYRLGSSMVILSRSFCDCTKITDRNVIRDKFTAGIRTLRAFEAEIAVHSDYFSKNVIRIRDCVEQILSGIAK